MGEIGNTPVNNNCPYRVTNEDLNFSLNTIIKDIRSIKQQIQHPPQEKQVVNHDEIRFPHPPQKNQVDHFTGGKKRRKTIRKKKIKKTKTRRKKR